MAGPGNRRRASCIGTLSYTDRHSFNGLLSKTEVAAWHSCSVFRLFSEVALHRAWLVQTLEQWPSSHWQLSRSDSHPSRPTQPSAFSGM